MKKSISLKDEIRCDIKNKLFIYYTFKKYEGDNKMLNKIKEKIDYGLLCGLYQYYNPYFDIENFLNNDMKINVVDTYRLIKIK